MVRLSESEKLVLNQAADQLGLPTASWARNELLRAAREYNSNKLNQIQMNFNFQKPNLLSLFCGPGGLDQGFADAGFHTALAFDNDEECINSFRFNHQNSLAYIRDVRELTLAELDKLYGSTFSPIGVIGGPPCQSFSVSNVYQKIDDPRHSLPESYANLLAELNQRNPISFFLFENVMGLLGKKHINRYRLFKNLFQDAGFKIYEKVLDAKYFGVPQERERIFIIGINDELHPGVEWVPPEPEKGLNTVRDAIEGLPEPIFNQRGLDPSTFDVHPNHWCLVPRSDKFGHLKEGEKWGRSFRTLYWDRPSWTVAYGHREVHVHPKGHRRLSVYEAMKLQTFPESYQLTGNMTAQIRLISEAVPVRLAWYVARSIIECLGL